MTPSTVAAHDHLAAVGPATGGGAHVAAARGPRAGTPSSSRQHTSGSSRPRRSSAPSGCPGARRGRRPRGRCRRRPRARRWRRGTARGLEQGVGLEGVAGLLHVRGRARHDLERRRPRISPISATLWGLPRGQEQPHQRHRGRRAGSATISRWRATISRDAALGQVEQRVELGRG